MLRVPLVRFAIILSLLCWLAGILGMIVILFPEAMHMQVVSLHYNIHFGVDEVGAWWRLFLPSILALVLTIGNLWYAARMWHKERVIAYTFVMTTLFANMFVLLHILFIVLLNLSYA